MQDDNKYEISDDIADIFDDYQAAMMIRDHALKLPWGYKKALKAAKHIVKGRRRFWLKIYKVYPELRGKKLEYIAETQMISEIEES